MPIATPDVYNEMLDRAKERGFAYPAINVSSSETLNAAIRGYAEAGSDGIVQVTGGAAFLSGQRLKDMVTEAVALAEFAHVVAAKHGQHRPPHRPLPQGQARQLHAPLIKLSQERVAAGQEPLFQSHMWTGRRCRWTRTSRSPTSCWPSAPRPGSSWRWRSASSAARRTTSSGR